MPFQKKRLSALAYVDEGQGNPIVFLHGNVTSSFMWRNIIPHLTPYARCIALDNIGQGDSDKLDNSGPDSYRLAEHQRYTNAALEALDLGDQVTIMVHDWGSQLGFTWAREHADRMRGIASMQALVGNFHWDHWPPLVQELFRRFRSEDGEQLVLQENHFVEQVLPAMVIRDLREEEMTEYRRPYRTPGEDRRRTLTWPREIPIEGEPADTLAVIEENDAFLRASPLPKLFINTEPGAVLVGEHRDIIRRWPHQPEVTVAGLHYCHEDSPHEIGRALADWYQTLG